MKKHKLETPTVCQYVDRAAHDILGDPYCWEKPTTTIQRHGETVHVCNSCAEIETIKTT